MAMTMELFNNQGQQSLADASAFKGWKYGKDNNFTGAGITEAVARHLLIGEGNNALKLFGPDVMGPGLCSDAQFAQTLFRDRVLSGKSAQPNVLGCEVRRGSFELDGHSHAWEIARPT